MSRFGLTLIRRRPRPVEGPIEAVPVTFILRDDVVVTAAVIYHSSEPGFRYDIVAALAAGGGAITTDDESLIEALASWPRDETGAPILVPFT